MFLLIINYKISYFSKIKIDIIYYIYVLCESTYKNCMCIFVTEVGQRAAVAGFKGFKGGSVFYELLLIKEKF